MTRSAISRTWPNDFTGLPHLEGGRSRSGCDCLGLARVIYAEMLGIALPDYQGGVCPEEHAEIDARIVGEAVSPYWRQIARGHERAFDLVVFRRGAWLRHIGVVVEPGLMIHAAPPGDSALCRYDRGAWSGRFAGLHRHVRMEGRG
ncbi:C40 family peptidase [Ponticoccus gilvus]|nr:C40 family peptidase [Enemella evansiae]